MDFISVKGLVSLLAAIVAVMVAFSFGGRLDKLVQNSGSSYAIKSNDLQLQKGRRKRAKKTIEHETQETLQFNKTEDFYANASETWQATGDELHNVTNPGPITGDHSWSNSGKKNWEEQLGKDRAQNVEGLIKKLKKLNDEGLIKPPWDVVPNPRNFQTWKIEKFDGPLLIGSFVWKDDRQSDNVIIPLRSDDVGELLYDHSGNGFYGTLGSFLTDPIRFKAWIVGKTSNYRRDPVSMGRNEEVMGPVQVPSGDVGVWPVAKIAVESRLPTAAMRELLPVRSFD